MSQGVDWAWGTPSAASLRAAGIKWAGRYFSYDAGKNIDAAEYRWLKGLGIGVVVVWETTATRALAGHGAGEADAHAAEAQRVRCGMPATQPLYFAVDFEANGPDVEAYFQGAHSVLKGRTGAYGGYDVIKYLFDHALISYGWQTYAWSGGRWDHRALFRQYSNGHVIGGVSCDYDVMLGTPASGNFTPADEARWIHEYDRLNGKHGPWAIMRRRVLVRYMTRRRKEIWRKAEPAGWETLNRRARYRALLARTEG